MVFIFINQGSSKYYEKAHQWFNSKGIELTKVNFSQLTLDQLFKILELSDNGFESIIINSNTNKLKKETKKEIKYLYSLCFNDACRYLLLHPYLLRNLIITDWKNIQIGWNEKDITCFLPREFRNIENSNLADKMKIYNNEATEQDFEKYYNKYL